MMERPVFGRSTLLTALRRNLGRQVDSSIDLDTRAGKECESRSGERYTILTELFLEHLYLFQRSSIGGQGKTIDGVVCTLRLGRVPVGCVNNRPFKEKWSIGLTQNRPEEER